MSVSTKSLLLLVLLPVVLGSPMDVLWSSPSLRGTGDVAEKRDNSFVWASIGDSWASGVSYYGSETDYDGDKYGCHRWKDSYGPKMERNTSWTTGTQTFHFAACMLISSLPARSLSQIRLGITYVALSASGIPPHKQHMY